MTPSLRLDRLNISSGQSPLVSDVTLALYPGRALTLLGESGSGKSLIAQAVFGTLSPTLRVSGEVVIDGVTTAAGNGVARRRLWGTRIGLVPQEPWLSLDPTMRVFEQMAETHAFVAGRDRAEARRHARDDLTRAGLAGAEEAFPHMLSGGMAQRAIFAITRAGGAGVLVVDEPTKGLDAPMRDRLVGQLLAALASGSSVMTITHDVHVARALGGDALVLKNGAIVELGPAAEVLTTPTDPYSRELLAAAPEMWPMRPRPAVRPPELVRLTSVSKSYGRRLVLSDVTLTVSSGERIVLDGPSGAGKSTLGDIMLGLRQPDTGAVDRTAALGRLAAQKLYQDPVAAFPHRATLGRTLDDLLERHRLDRQQATALMQRLSLDSALLGRQPSNVSGGELQRFALLRVLLMRPKLVVADEPTSRLDPITQKTCIDLLLETIGRAGASLVLITHDPAIARAVGGRVVTLGRHTPLDASPTTTSRP